MKTIWIVLIIGAFFIGGCGDEEIPCVLQPPTVDSITPPTTCDMLMENFERIYTEVWIDEFREMLHPDFQFILSSGTVSDWGLEPEATFDFNVMESIHEHMFGGNAGTDHEGNGISPLDRIEISLMERIGEWVDVPQHEPDFPGTSRALYAVKIFLHDNTGTHAYAIDQAVYFYASSVGGIWYLQGILPLVSVQSKDSQWHSYDWILSLYR